MTLAIFIHFFLLPIAGDIDFAADVADFKRRKGMTVILIHPSNASQSLLHAASHHIDFHQLMAAVPFRPLTNNSTEQLPLLAGGGGDRQPMAELEWERQAVQQTQRFKAGELIVPFISEFKNP